MFGLVIVYAGVLIVNVLSTARQFIAHSRDRIELREQGEIIKLLREFEASGSGGLWELDGDLSFVKMSPELLARNADFAKSRSSAVITAGCSIQPARSSPFRPACADLFSDLESGTPFRDRAIPSRRPATLVVDFRQADPSMKRRSSSAGAALPPTSPRHGFTAMIQSAPPEPIR